MYIKYPHTVRRNLKVAAISLSCLASAFTFGLITSGSVTPATLIEAGGPLQPGDVDGNGYVTVEDVALILEIAQGYQTATADQLKADPNEDGNLTVDDAISLLTILSL